VTLLRERRGNLPGGLESPEDTAPGWGELARRITAGDADAEAELARWFHARIRLIAFARLHGSDAADDVAQDVIVAVLEALRAGRVRDPDHLPAFVVGIANNLINSRHRAATQGREVQSQRLDPPSPADSVVTELDFAERRALVRAALAQLGSVDRMILILSMVDGLKPREIAPRVGLTADVVRTRKTRAVKALTEAVRAARDTKRPAAPLMSTTVTAVKT
jgi:RNA polymerase sigma factor (sigma-70 family)